MEIIKIEICDDYQYMCDYFSESLGKEEDFEIVGKAFDSPSCLKICKETKPDVILLDIQMEEKDSGLTLIPKLKKINPNIKIILLTIHENDDYIIRCFKLKADNYVVKTDSLELVKKAIRDAYANNVTLEHKISKVLLQEFNQMYEDQMSMLHIITLLSNLSSSELSILYALCNEKSYKEIAKERCVEVITIRSQAASILKKFGVCKMNLLIKQLKSLNVLEAFKVFQKKMY